MEGQSTCGRLSPDQSIYIFFCQTNLAFINKVEGISDGLPMF